MNGTNYSDKYRQHYNEGAKDYDRTRFGSLKGGYAKQVKNEIIISILAARKMLKEETAIIDVAAGTGRIAADLVKKPFSHVFVSDISSEMLKAAMNNIAPEFHKKVTFTLLDMKSLPFPDASFDAATLGSFFYLIPLEEYCSHVADIFRILKPGGILISEVSNALCIANPRNALYVLTHKHLKRRKVKSYLYPWDIRRIFKAFELEEMVGIDYPMVTKEFDVHRRLCGFLGHFVPTKFFGGKFILVLRKK